jgi:hypothetical protein
MSLLPIRGDADDVRQSIPNRTPNGTRSASDGRSGLHLAPQWIIRAQRQRTAARFRGPRDGLRPVALGAILVELAALAFLGPIFGSRLASYAPGFPAIFGGALPCIINPAHQPAGCLSIGS